MLCYAMTQDELFGPILPTVRFSNLEQCIGLVKELPTGKPLALYCYSTDSRVIDAVKRRTTSGARIDSKAHAEGVSLSTHSSQAPRSSQAACA